MLKVKVVLADTLALVVYRAIQVGLVFPDLAAGRASPAFQDLADPVYPDFPAGLVSRVYPGFLDGLVNRVFLDFPDGPA